MKKLVAHVLFFLLLAVTLYGGAVAFINSRMRQNVVVKADKGVTSIVIGHSHPQCAFNTAMIDGMQNFASSGEAYLYTWEKLKLILARNPQIRTVFVEFTNNQINPSKDEWMWREDVLSKHYTLVAPFMEREEQLLLATHNFPGYVTAFCFASRRSLYNMLMRDYNYSDRLGGYHLLKDNKLDAMQQQQEEWNREGVSEKNLSYLERIVALCRESGVMVYLVRSPLHPDYPGWANETVFQAQRVQRFPEVPFLDFGRFPLPADHFADLAHLNNKGAAQFSRWFDQLLHQGLLQEKDIQQTINTAMDTLSVR